MFQYTPVGLRVRDARPPSAAAAWYAAVNDDPKFCDKYKVSKLILIFIHEIIISSKGYEILPYKNVSVSYI